VTKVAGAIAPQPDETFLEIGPGLGALTRPLAAAAKEVFAVEIDRDLAGRIRESGLANVHVIEGDFLDLQELPRVDTALRVAGNLPYNVASPILFKLADFHEAGVPLADVTVMLQREVADRLLAEPGIRDYGVLTVLIRHTADVQRLLNLPPGAFRPSPKVQSSVVRLRFHPPAPRVRSRPAFRALVQAAFTHRRKTLANALRSSLASAGVIDEALAATGIDGTRRPETLTIEEFAHLSDRIGVGSRF
jgi:16S rRNA (adenine1518-N6/adenine1519-N6)-dimethyltransferase